MTNKTWLMFAWLLIGSVLGSLLLVYFRLRHPIEPENGSWHGNDDVLYSDLAKMMNDYGKVTTMKQLSGLASINGRPLEITAMCLLLGGIGLIYAIFPLIGLTFRELNMEVGITTAMTNEE